jgi:hypothetical protein
VLVLDESLGANVIAVGGYIVMADRLTDVVRVWRTLKRDVFGLDPRAELKYTMEPQHPARPHERQRGYRDAGGWTAAPVEPPFTA